MHLIHPQENDVPMVVMIHTIQVQQLVIVLYYCCCHRGRLEVEDSATLPKLLSNTHTLSTPCTFNNGVIDSNTIGIG